MVEVFDRIGFNDELFRGQKCTRLKRIQSLLASKRLDEKLNKISEG